jgi:hypothetical protein
LIPGAEDHQVQAAQVGNDPAQESGPLHIHADIMHVWMRQNHCLPID